MVIQLDVRPAFYPMKPGEKDRETNSTGIPVVAHGRGWSGLAECSVVQRLARGRLRPAESQQQLRGLAPVVVRIWIDFHEGIKGINTGRFRSSVIMPRPHPIISTLHLHSLDRYCYR
jgi:hypothetical protein